MGRKPKQLGLFDRPDVEGDRGAAVRGDPKHPQVVPAALQVALEIFEGAIIHEAEPPVASRALKRRKAR